MFFSWFFGFSVWLLLLMVVGGFGFLRERERKRVQQVAFWWCLAESYVKGLWFHILKTTAVADPSWLQVVFSESRAILPLPRILSFAKCFWRDFVSLIIILLEWNKFSAFWTPLFCSLFPPQTCSSLMFPLPCFTEGRFTSHYPKIRRNLLPSDERISQTILNLYFLLLPDLKG